MDWTLIRAKSLAASDLAGHIHFQSKAYLYTVVFLYEQSKLFVNNKPLLTPHCSKFRFVRFH